MNRTISDMDPIDIQYKLRKAGVTQVKLAKDLDKTGGMISQVITGQRNSEEIQRAIATAIGLDVKLIWPSIYILQGGPRKPGRPKAA